MYEMSLKTIKYRRDFIKQRRDFNKQRRDFNFIRNLLGALSGAFMYFPGIFISQAYGEAGL